MHRHLRSCALLAALALAAAGCTVNPVSGQQVFNLMGKSDEMAMGIKDHPSIVYMYDGEYQDPELVRYLGSIVMRLVRCSHRPDMQMDFTIVNSSVINAFAIPGHVYATRGFLAKLQNEAQFAAVMGHELTHVTAGHSAQKLSRNMVVGMVTDLANSVAGANPTAQAAMKAGNLGVSLLGLSFSREEETQADRVGTYYMALAGYDPHQAVAMQQLLQLPHQQRHRRAGPLHLRPPHRARPHRPDPVRDQGEGHREPLHPGGRRSSPTGGSGTLRGWWRRTRRTNSTTRAPRS